MKTGGNIKGQLSW